ncbi:hypothetical protein V8B97DRAFT_2027067 [Scleroderma yunnanense]
MSFCQPRQFTRCHCSSIKSACPLSASDSSAPSALSGPSSTNPTVLVDCDTIKHTCHVPGTALLFLPVEQLLTLPGCCAFTQQLCVLSEPCVQTSSTTVHAPSAHSSLHSKGRTYPGPEFDEDDLLTDGLHVSQYPLSLPLRHTCKKMRQWQWWSNEVIPSLVQLFHDPITPWPQICKGQCVCHHLKVECINYDNIQTIGIVVCSCITAVQQLLQMSYFPCAPLAPTLAVSLKLLNLVKHLFVHIPPNISAWCEALQSYLGSMGYSVDSKVRLLFSNAYHWHCILEITVDEYVQQCTQACSTLIPVTPSSGSLLPSLPMPHTTASPSALMPSTSFPTLALNVLDHSRKWPSEYLCSCCPLCFCHWKDINQDSSFEVDAIVCIDACFTQKHHSGQQDDPVNPTSTVFLDQDVVDAMEDEVEELQGAQSSLRRKRILRSVAQTELDQYEQGMKIPVSVLDGCNESFMAADEKHQKASTCFFSDTGVMALLCHHDCVIHLVNMKSTGKKQHYALALIKALFSHLPEDFCVGILYDIGYCHKLQSSAYLQHCLHQKKFALERLEHSYQSTVNEQKLHDHTEASVKCHEPGIQKLGTTYNNVCIHMAALVHQGKAPQGSVAPLPISWDGLFRLDDIGLGDGIDGQPPAWLANEREKESHILQEKKVLTEWFSEDEDLRYELVCKSSILANICLAWQIKLSEMPSLPRETWGVSVEELQTAVCTSSVVHTVVSEDDTMDADSENELNEVPMDDELLDVAEEFALADEYHHQLKIDVEGGYIQGEQ